MLRPRALTDHEHAALSFLSGGGRISLSDVESRNGFDVIGSPIPGRRTWTALIDAGLVLDPIEDPILLETGEVFTFTAFLEITDLGRQSLLSGSIPPKACSDDQDPTPAGMQLQP